MRELPRNIFPKGWERSKGRGPIFYIVRLSHSGLKNAALPAIPSGDGGHRAALRLRKKVVEVSKVGCLRSH